MIITNIFFLQKRHIIYLVYDWNFSVGAILLEREIIISLSDKYRVMVAHFGTHLEQCTSTQCDILQQTNSLYSILCTPNEEIFLIQD